MRIHTKLFILLILISVLPLVALSLRGQRATENLGQTIADRGREAVWEQIELQLQQAIGFSSDILSAEQRQVEDVLRLQAREAEIRLAAPLPSDDQPVYFDRDFDSPGTWPPGTELALDHTMVSPSREVKAVPVSRRHQAFYVAPSTPPLNDIPAPLKADMHRLLGLDGIYRTLSDTNPGLFYWQYVSLQNGVHSVYPGHGGYPAGFDPRTRAWYEAGLW